jgi:hypothetical protein
MVCLGVSMGSSFRITVVSGLGNLLKDFVRGAQDVHRRIEADHKVKNPNLPVVSRRLNASVWSRTSDKINKTNALLNRFTKRLQGPLAECETNLFRFLVNGKNFCEPFIFLTQVYATLYKIKTEVTIIGARQADAKGFHENMDANFDGFGVRYEAEIL